MDFHHNYAQYWQSVYLLLSDNTALMLPQMSQGISEWSTSCWRQARTP